MLSWLPQEIKIKLFKHHINKLNIPYNKHDYSWQQVLLTQQFQTIIFLLNKQVVFMSYVKQNKKKVIMKTIS